MKNKNNKIRVLIVDDSLLFREIITRGLSSDSLIQIIAVAGDPYDARDKIIEYEPDVMVCDIEMPRMNGIEFVRQLMPQYPMPVIVISSLSDAVFNAMSAGAVDFLPKPSVSSAYDVQCFIADLITKIKIASKSKFSANVDNVQNRISGEGSDKNHNIIAIGASTGGTQAISNIITALPPSLPGIVIVQHIPPVFSKMFADRLNMISAFDVKEAMTGDLVTRGRVLIAPGDRHMSIKKHGDSYRVECFNGEKVNGHCPSVDVLFNSVAQAAGDKAIGVILTGMGYDGAKGLLAMKRKGAYTIGQDEESSVVYGMPKAAYELGALHRRASLKDIPGLIFRQD